ncbi:von Willebrand factor type A domain-containing protein [Halosimplex carlsbadense 2-9-1]|uniref:von Willebrand factor type A domain-containing protein n=1 Tax=Halosimplex carlsbadense 2-9-1 TaxID=797114 RepID=M0CWG0_9EURY|nr:VWA domain-containing protein [Halosimplex carlsbadense]ELZ27556.1 von Willebrand factor type A domain-containing protein [Halosimplex carlsbadense 2-9-1]
MVGSVVAPVVATPIAESDGADSSGGEALGPNAASESAVERSGPAGHRSARQQTDDGSASNGSLDVTVRQVARPEFPEVTAYVSVRNESGDPVTGLTADDFDIVEEGTNQTVESVEPATEVRGSNVSAALVIDRSGSMRGSKIRDARAAAGQFVDQLGAGDEGFAIDFGSRVEFTQRWTTDTDRLGSAIDGIDTGGGTVLWRAASEGIGEAGSRVGRSAVIVLTDGRNTDPSNDVSGAIDDARAAGVPVYTIGLGRNVNEGSLRRLALETGGSYYRSPNSSQLAAIYADISESLTAEYRVTYTTTDTATDGTNRTVELSAESGGDAGSGTGSYQAPCAPLPEAAFEYAPGDPVAGQPVEFDANASDPNGGEIVAYRWDFDNDGVVDAVGRNVTHSYANASTYSVRLAVEKGCGASDVGTEAIGVGSPDPIRPESVDDFEDGDVSEYVPLAGSTDAWRLNTTTTTEGGSALQYAGSADPAEIASFSGLDTYPEKGDVLRFDIGTYGSWDFRTSFQFGQQPDSGFNNRYEVELEPQTDTVRLQYDPPNESDRTLGATDVDLQRNRFYTVEVDWAASTDDIALRVYEAPIANASAPLGTIRAPEPQGAPTSGGIGFFGHGEGDRWIYDDVRVLDPSEIRSPRKSLIEIVASEQGEYEYEIVVDGTAEKANASRRVKAEANDEIRRTDDGRTVIDGFTGNAGYGDAYRFEGTIENFTRISVETNVTIRINGTEVSADDLADDGSRSLDPPGVRSASTGGTAGGPPAVTGLWSVETAAETATAVPIPGPTRIERPSGA